MKYQHPAISESPYNKVLLVVSQNSHFTKYKKYITHSEHCLAYFFLAMDNNNIHTCGTEIKVWASGPQTGSQMKLYQALCGASKLEKPSVIEV